MLRNLPSGVLPNRVLSVRKCVVACLTLATVLPGYGQTAQQPLKLSLDDAIQRGLKANLGVLERESADRIVRAERIRSLSALLPTVNAYAAENVQKNNIAVFGFRFPGIPQIIGPFGFSDIRATAEANLFDQKARKNWQATAKEIEAATLNTQDAKDLVVQAVANAYLTILADAARVESTKVEVTTAQALYERARDQHAAGVSPAIDELRAQVELKSREQQLLAGKNRSAKDKLALQQAIGIPGSQEIELTDNAPYSPLANLTAEQLNEQARAARADYQSLKIQIESAQLAREAVLAGRLPVLALNGNYGYNGVNMSQSRGTFQFAAEVKVNVFDGGRIKADVLQSDAVIQQRKDELADLERRIDTDIRSALLDLQSAADQVNVAQSNLELANETLTQARDRFAAGVTDNIEVVQAQDSVAGAEENLIASRYAHNLAKVALARAIGKTEINLKQFIGGK
jgi:outer membrane protein TolC